MKAKVKHIKKPNVKRLKKQDEELKKIGDVKKIDKKLSDEEKFLNKILKRFKKL